MAYWSDNLGGSRIAQTLLFEDYGKHNAVLRSTQDCTPLLDENARIRNEARTRTPHGTRIAARVPEIHYWILWPQEFQARHGYHPRRYPKNVDRRHAEKAWRDFVVAKLNDRDFSQLRVDDGKRMTSAPVRHL